MKNTLYMRLAAWGVVGACVAATYGYLLLSAAVSESQVQYSSSLEQMATTNARSAAAARSHALFEDTAHARAELERFAAADVVAAASAIEQLSSREVLVQVKGATLVTSPTDQERGMHAVDMAVDATGTFGEVIRVSQMLDAIAFPITIEQFDIVRVMSSSTPWHLTARVRLHTTTNVSL